MLLRAMLLGQGDEIPDRDDRIVREMLVLGLEDTNILYQYYCLFQTPK